jgi:hypothetical protein
MGASSMDPPLTPNTRKLQLSESLLGGLIARPVLERPTAKVLRRHVRSVRSMLPVEKYAIQRPRYGGAAVGRAYLVLEVERLKERVRRAFATVKRPANGALHASDVGEHGALLEQDFRDKPDWRTLGGAFLDQAPGGFGSALSFFSPAALRYFLPAYLIADLDGQLDRVDVASRLSAPFTEAARNTAVNRRRYGSLTHFEAGQQRFADFGRDEVAAIVAFLEHKAAADHAGVLPIGEALANYWRPRLARG